MASMTPRRWLVLMAAVLTAMLTARLGWWQLQRAEQKLNLQAQLASRGSQPALSVAQLARDATEAAAQHHTPVQLRGHWLPAHTVFLDNRQMNGRPGFFVLTPLQLAAGDAVLVQRGWVPRNFVDRSALPAVPTPPGLVLVPGRVAPPPSRLFDFAGGPDGRIRQNLELPAYAREVGLAFRPVSVLQTAAAQALPADGAAAALIDDGLARQWPAPAVDVGKHHGYAFQWFALSALVTALYVWFQVIQPRRR